MAQNPPRRSGDLFGGDSLPESHLETGNVQTRERRLQGGVRLASGQVHPRQRHVSSRLGDALPGLRPLADGPVQELLCLRQQLLPGAGLALQRLGQL